MIKWTGRGDTRRWYRAWTKVRYGWLVLGWICSRRGHDFQEQFLTAHHRLSACSRCGRYRGAQRITPYPERRQT